MAAAADEEGFVLCLRHVSLDETKPDQVRLHHIIFLGKLVLAAITQTNDACSLQKQTMLFLVATNFFT
jgi:hypothetical protein